MQSISKFISSEKADTLRILASKEEGSLKTSALQQKVSELPLMVRNALSENHREARDKASSGKLPNFITVEYILVARGTFSDGQKIAMCWKGPRWVVQTVHDYVPSSPRSVQK